MTPPEHCDQLTSLGFEHAFAVPADPAPPLPELYRGQQVHGTDLARAPAVTPDDPADALWTSTPNVAVCVITADCVPVLVVDRESRGVAAVHAGWRGMGGGIVQLSVSRFCALVGCRPRDLVVAVGPHIGRCCYEVDEPVRRAIDIPDAFGPGRDSEHYLLDLFDCTRAQLRRTGVPTEHVYRVGGCTACDTAGYPSYRRDGTFERMLHYVRMPQS